MTAFSITSLVHIEQTQACLPPPWNVETQSVAAEKPDCLTLPTKDFGRYKIDNQCKRHLKVSQLDCQNCAVETFDYNTPEANQLTIEQQDGPAYEQRYLFTLGTPEATLDQAFDDQTTQLSFEVTIKVSPPTELQLEELRECEKGQMEDMEEDLPTVDMGDDMDSADMNNSSGQNTESPNGCTTTNTTPTSHTGWIALIALVFGWRRRQHITGN